jgi:hypothetical protein
VAHHAQAERAVSEREAAEEVDHGQEEAAPRTYDSSTSMAE